MSIEIIHLLEDEIFKTEKLLNSLQEKLKREKLHLQEKCSHDQFIATDNGDYHKPGYYYTCKFCDICFCSRPKSGEISYQ